MPTTNSNREFQQGLIYTSWWHSEYLSSESDKTLSNLIKPTGANWLQVIVTWYQANLSSMLIYPKEDTSTPSDEDLLHVIQEAKRLGMGVMVKPHLDLESSDGHWRGEISHENDETAWNSWFKNYTVFISHYATLAQRAEANLFVVGTELAKTTLKSIQWRAVINEVRTQYSGQLTYAAHHENELHSIDWWDALDFIGIDAYYPLSSVNNPSIPS